MIYCIWYYVWYIIYHIYYWRYYELLFGPFFVSKTSHVLFSRNAPLSMVRNLWNAQFSESDGKMWQIKVFEHEKLSILKMNRLGFGALQGKMQIWSNDEYLIRMIFGKFKVLYNIYNYLRWARYRIVHWRVLENWTSTIHYRMDVIHFHSE